MENNVFNSVIELNGNVLKFIEINDETGAPSGRSMSLVGIQFKALDYATLINQSHDKVAIPLRWDNAQVIESTIPNINIEQFIGGYAALETHYSSRTIGLVKGGWLPAGLALEDEMILIPDRCTISELISRYKNGNIKHGKKEDFSDLFLNRTIRINPLLFALEGNAKKNPPPDLVKQQYHEACEKIQSALPHAKIFPSGEGGVLGTIGIINDTQSGLHNKQDFLLKIASKLHGNVAKRNRSALWNEVLSTADDCKVPRRSLVVLAALSAISVPNGKSPAKRLLKVTDPNYSAELAYNALSDLRSLELLMHMMALFPKEKILMCTGDKDLALFWTGIRASDFIWSDEKLQFKFSPVSELLPEVNKSQLDEYFQD